VYEFVLFLHLVTLAAAFLAMGVMLNCVMRLRAATDVSSARATCAALAGIEKVMPAATVLLLVTGGYLTHARWTWTTPWIDVAIAGLIAVTIFGGGVLGGRARSLQRALTEARSGGVDAATARLLADPLFVVGNVANIGLVVAVMFVMVVKPALAGGIVALVVGAACGAFAGAAAIRPRAAVPTAAQRAEA